METSSSYGELIKGVGVNFKKKRMAKKSKKSILKKVGHELKVNPPAILAKTAKKKGPAQAEKQRKAILLSKARKAGAKIAKKKGKKVAYNTYA